MEVSSSNGNFESLSADMVLAHLLSKRKEDGI